MANSDVQAGTTCGSLLRELQIIWDEVGESEGERDRMLLELEQECLEVYRRKVKQASHSQAKLRQALSDAASELSSLVSILGDHPPLLGKTEMQAGATLKEQLASLQPQLNEFRRKKEERASQFVDVKTQIQRICAEISGSIMQPAESDPNVSTENEPDLSINRLDGYQEQLHSLQQEKNERLRKVSDSIAAVHELCAVLGLDFFKIITEVHPSLDDSGGQSKSISNHTIERLDRAVRSLRQEKNARIRKLRDLGGSLMDLWNLMDTPAEERQLFQHITCVITADEDQVVAPRALALDNIEQAEVEVERLDQLKASKMKELVTKKHSELEEIYRRGHMEPDPATALDKFVAIIDSGMFDPSELLASIDGLIAEAQEEALSRKDIMDKMDKWMAACEEERWLDDYNRDDNRYNASRGAHINLKRAEKARITVNKIPAMVDTLVVKTKVWEEERAVLFLYDGIRLLDMLEEYALLRQEREEEKRQLRDQKRMQELMITEQETLFGTRPSPNKVALSTKKGGAAAMTGNRRLSLQQNTGTAEPMAARGGANGLTPVRTALGSAKDSKREKGGGARQPPVVTTPSSYATLPKEDCPAAAPFSTSSLSPSSANGSEPPSPTAAPCSKNGAVAVGSYA